MDGACCRCCWRIQTCASLFGSAAVALALLAFSLSEQLAIPSADSSLQQTRFIAVIIASGLAGLALAFGLSGVQGHAGWGGSAAPHKAARIHYCLAAVSSAASMLAGSVL